MDTFITCAVDDSDSDLETLRCRDFRPLPDVNVLMAAWRAQREARTKLVDRRGDGIALPHLDDNLESNPEEIFGTSSWPWV